MIFNHLKNRIHLRPTRRILKQRSFSEPLTKSSIIIDIAASFHTLDLLRTSAEILSSRNNFASHESSSCWACRLSFPSRPSKSDRSSRRCYETTQKSRVELFVPSSDRRSLCHTSQLTKNLCLFTPGRSFRRDTRMSEAQGALSGQKRRVPSIAHRPVRRRRWRRPSLFESSSPPSSRDASSSGIG